MKMRRIILRFGIRTVTYLLISIQIIILLLVPRFGWSIRNTDTRDFHYAGTVYTDGDYHVSYKNDGDIIDICYTNRFSREFILTVNKDNVYHIEVEVDGMISICEPSIPFYTLSDIVWKDSSGIFYWRYILVIILTLFCIRLLKYTKGYAFCGTGNRRMQGYFDCQKKRMLYICSLIVYLVAMLISLRIVS